MYYSIRTIVVGAGELEEPDSVLSAAVTLAERTGAEVHAVHAYEIPRLIWDAYLEVGADHDTVQDEIAEANAEALAQMARRVAPGVRVHCHALRGTPDQAVNEVVREVNADLIVIGASHHRALARPMLGTAAQRVLRRATTPVFVLRRALPARFDHVLLATDLSELSASVHEIGLDVVDALSNGAPPEVESLLTIELPLGLPTQISSGDLARLGARQLGEFLALRRPRRHEIGARVRFGVPATEILDEALEWSADLVILGTHSRTGPDRFWLGSVAEAVLRGTRCSALVIPTGAVDRLHLPVGAGATAARPGDFAPPRGVVE